VCRGRLSAAPPRGIQAPEMENTQYAYINDIDSADEGEEEVSSSPPPAPRPPPGGPPPPPPPPDIPCITDIFEIYGYVRKILNFKD